MSKKKEFEFDESLSLASYGEVDRYLVQIFCSNELLFSQQTGSYDNARKLYETIRNGFVKQNEEILYDIVLLKILDFRNLNSYAKGDYNADLRHDFDKLKENFNKFVYLNKEFTEIGD